MSLLISKWRSAFHRIHADAPLDVMLVHFSSVPRGAFGDLEKGRKKPRAAPKSLGWHCFEQRRRSQNESIPIGVCMIMYVCVCIWRCSRALFLPKFCWDMQHDMNLWYRAVICRLDVVGFAQKRWYWYDAELFTTRNGKFSFSFGWRGGNSNVIVLG